MKMAACKILVSAATIVGSAFTSELCIEIADTLWSPMLKFDFSDCTLAASSINYHSIPPKPQLRRVNLNQRSSYLRSFANARKTAPAGASIAIRLLRAFRQRVLKAYEYRCAVCGFDV